MKIPKKEKTLKVRSKKERDGQTRLCLGRGTINFTIKVRSKKKLTGSTNFGVRSLQGAIVHCQRIETGFCCEGKGLSSED